MCFFFFFFSFVFFFCCCFFFFFQAEDGIRDLVRSRGLGDVYKRQMLSHGVNAVGLFFIADILIVRYGNREMKDMGGIAHVSSPFAITFTIILLGSVALPLTNGFVAVSYTHLDAADERSSVDLGGRRIIKKTKK